MVLPRRLLGQSSIRYVRDEDRDKPKSSATPSSWTSRWRSMSRTGGAGSWSTRSSCTAPTSPSASRARATSPCSTRLHDAPRPLRFVTCRHEAGAANMAEAYGKLTGPARHLPRHPRAGRDARRRRRPHGVPGLDADAPPVGQVAREQREREAFQEVDYRGHVRAAGQVGGPDRRCRRASRSSSRAPSHARPRAGPGRSCSALPEDMLTERADVADAAPLPPVAAAPRPGGRRRRCAARLERGRAAVRARRRRRVGRRRRPTTCGPWPRRRAAGRRVVPLPGLPRQPLAALRRRRRASASTRRSPRACARPTCCSSSARGSASRRRPATRCWTSPRAARRRSCTCTPTPRSSAASTRPTLAIVARRRAALAAACARRRARRRRGRATGARGARADYEAWLRRRRAAPGGVNLGAVMAHLREAPAGRRHRHQRRRQLHGLAAPLLPLPALPHAARADAAARWATACPPRVAAKAVHPDRTVVASRATAAS